MKQFDVIVIGAGPAGYVAAIRCAQLGLNTACIDDWLNEDNLPSPGGTCLNVGCIPSKALLESSELFEQCQNNMAAHGINTAKVTFDLATMMQRKQKVVRELTNGIEVLIEANKIQFYSGTGKLLADNKVKIKTRDSTETTIHAEHVILAPGSIPKPFATIPCNTDLVVDSTGALDFNHVPEQLAIIGAGVIALELGSVWRRLGADVTLFKSSSKLLPAADTDISKQAEKIFSEQGLNFCFGSQINNSEIKNNKIEISYTQENSNKTKTFDKVIVAIGRTPNTKNIATAACELESDEKGFIRVDEQCRTNTPGVYAIGDAVRGPMLAHKGEQEGIMVAELIAGQYSQVNYTSIPLVIYTAPEIAWCGKTEQQLISGNIPYKSGSFPFANNGRAHAMNNKQGLIKVLADARTDRVLGVHMIGPHVSELIGQAVIAMEFQTSSEDLAMTMFAHPSLSEVFHEAALDVLDQAIHKGTIKIT
jgi:dihydrolipoamide dehydrogenase